MGHADRHTDRHPGRVVHNQLSDLQSKRPRPASAAFPCPEPEFLLAAHVAGNSCTTPRSHVRIIHLPEDVPYRGFDPHLPCHPPLSQVSSRLPKNDVPSFPQVGVPHCLMKHCGLQFTNDFCVARPHTELPPQAPRDVLDRYATRVCVSLSTRSEQGNGWSATSFTIILSSVCAPCQQSSTPTVSTWKIRQTLHGNLLKRFNA